MDALIAPRISREIRKRSSHAMTPAKPHMMAADYKDGRKMKRMTVLAMLWMTCSAIAIATVAAAAEARGAAVDAATEPGPFDKGTYNFALTASYLTPARFSEDELLNVNVSAGYFLWDNHSVNLE